MKHQPHHLTFLDPLPSHVAQLPVAPGMARRGVWSVWCRPFLLWGMGVLAVVGLLLAFHAVATQAVNQSVLQRQARSAQSQALWRCTQLPGKTARQTCLRDLAAPQVSGL